MPRHTIDAIGASIAGCTAPLKNFRGEVCTGGAHADGHRLVMRVGGWGGGRRRRGWEGPPTSVSTAHRCVGLSLLQRHTSLTCTVTVHSCSEVALLLPMSNTMPVPMGPRGGPSGAVQENTRVPAVMVAARGHATSGAPLRMMCRTPDTEAQESLEPTVTDTLLTAQEKFENASCSECMGAWCQRPRATRVTQAQPSQPSEGNDKLSPCKQDTPKGAVRMQARRQS